MKTMSKEIISVTDIKKEIGTFISTPENLATLLQTTFKGLTQQSAEQAMIEGMIRGYTLKDFLEKNLYAVPFKDGYSLITSIDLARKIGMRSGVVGVSKPEYETDENGNPITCTITVKRKIEDFIGEFSATIYFKEYYAGHKNPDGSIKKNKYGDVKPTLWDNKPMTMIAKVAEMHALRKAAPEALSQTYVEEEYQKSYIDVEAESDTKGIELANVRKEVGEITTIDELREYANTKAKGKGKEVTKIITEKLAFLKALEKEVEVEVVEDLNPADYPFPDEQ